MTFKYKGWDPQISKDYGQGSTGSVIVRETTSDDLSPNLGETAQEHHDRITSSRSPQLTAEEQEVRLREAHEEEMKRVIARKLKENPGNSTS